MSKQIKQNFKDENIFFNKSDLKFCGDNVIIGKTVRIRYPERVEIADNVIIDDFCYISTSLKLSSFVHISAGCKIIGGANALVTFEEFSTLAPNVVIAAGSDDYTGGIATPFVDSSYKGASRIGTVKIGKHCVVGSNSTILPDVELKIGAAVGAQSLVNSDIPQWELHGGIPSRKLKDRDKLIITKLENLWRQNEQT